MTKKADRLGTSQSFARATPVSSRRAAIAAATGAPTDGIGPPTELPVNRVSLNPANPRSELGDLTDLIGSLRDHGQKTAISIMARDAYLQANPAHADDLEPDTTHVVIDGSSRLAASREAGMKTIKVMVDDSLGSDEDELLESALVANIHRQDLKPLDEAGALKQLLGKHGTQQKLAKRLHRSQGWVSQRLALLDLTPELKARLLAKEEDVELLRAVGKSPADLQDAELQRLKSEKAEKDAAKRQRKAALVSGKSTDPQRDSAGPGDDAHDGVVKPALEDGAATHAASEASDPEPVRPDAMPWASPQSVMRIVTERMTPEDRQILVKLLVEHDQA